jgi:undecaprenyl-diphosphatase
VILAGGELLRRRQSAEAKFAFLLATPIIMAAGVLKLPTLAGPAGQGILGQVLVGAIVAAVAAYLSVRFLTRYFHSQTLLPFAAYCLVAGAVSVIRFS